MPRAHLGQVINQVSKAKVSELEPAAHSVLKYLKVSEEFTRHTSNPAASAIIPLLKHVKTKCSPSDDASTLAKEMQRATCIWSDMEQRYSFSVIETLSTATFLDHRFKDQYLEKNTKLVCRAPS